MDAYKEVTAILAEHLDCKASELTMETVLGPLGIDYLEIIEIILELEDKLSIYLSPIDLPRTVADLVNLLQPECCA